MTAIKPVGGSRLLALFNSPCWLARLQSSHSELVLDRLIGEG